MHFSLTLASSSVTVANSLIPDSELKNIGFLKKLQKYYLRKWVDIFESLSSVSDNQRRNADFHPYLEPRPQD